jgi:anaerobic selenocysteine-containing dehydrogenase
MGMTTEGKTYKEMADGGVDVLLAVGELPASGKPKADFIIAQTSYMTDTAKDADILLPAASYLEAEGTVTNYLGSVKKVNKCVATAGDSKQHKDIVTALSKAMGSEISVADLKSVQETSKAVFSPFEKKQGLDADPAELIESVNTCALNHSRLLWLKEAKASV